jgi:hypothetical protein
MSRTAVGVALAVGLLAAHGNSAPQTPTGLMPVTEVRPGMTGIGRTVFQGETVEDFQVNIIGVLHNIIGPNRDLILAKLAGGPLAEAGVIAGMSGSPVYVNGRLIGAVSYALGSFPREPIAGITPISEMMTDAASAGVRTRSSELDIASTAAPADVLSTLRRLVQRATSLQETVPSNIGVIGPASLVDLAPTLRPIGVAMVMSGFDPSVSSVVQQALGETVKVSATQAPRAEAPALTTATLHGGDAVGVSLLRGDLEMGATGTVTYVDGSRVYAFGHPFLNLGPTSMAMTRAYIYTILPSLENSMKVAGMGPVVGVMNQDRESAIGGTLGPAPREVPVSVSLTSDHAPDRHFSFSVVHDQQLTALFSYVAVLNAIANYERQSGALTIAMNGSIAFGADGRVAINDLYAGDQALATAANCVLAPLTAMTTNEWRAVMPDSIDMTVHTSEAPASATIERAWLDTTKPTYGSSATLYVQLRNYRGSLDTVSTPVTMPSLPSGTLSLLVADAPTLSALEQRELKPGKPRTVAELVESLNATRRNNRLYVRLLSSTAGAVVAGETLPALPASTRDILGADRSMASAPLSRTVIGAWELRLDRVIRGSRELPITLTFKQ